LSAHEAGVTRSRQTTVLVTTSAEPTQMESHHELEWETANVERFLEDADHIRGSLTEGEQNKLIVENTKLVTHIAAGLLRRKKEIPFEDLVAEGMLGLVPRRATKVSMSSLPSRLVVLAAIKRTAPQSANVSDLPMSR
jgi:DNA-directed RNA polymerase sigma subunit (sigma70/sigma32)